MYPRRRLAAHSEHMESRLVLSSVCGVSSDCDSDDGRDSDDSNDRDDSNGNQDQSSETRFRRNQGQTRKLRNQQLNNSTDQIDVDSRHRKTDDGKNDRRQKTDDGESGEQQTDLNGTTSSGQTNNWSDSSGHSRDDGSSGDNSSDSNSTSGDSSDGNSDNTRFTNSSGSTNESSIDAHSIDDNSSDSNSTSNDSRSDDSASDDSRTNDSNQLSDDSASNTVTTTSSLSISQDDSRPSMNPGASSDDRDSKAEAEKTRFDRDATERSEFVGPKRSNTVDTPIRRSPEIAPSEETKDVAGETEPEARVSIEFASKRVAPLLADEAEKTSLRIEVVAVEGDNVRIGPVLVEPIAAGPVREVAEETVDTPRQTVDTPRQTVDTPPQTEILEEVRVVAEVEEIDKRAAVSAVRIDEPDVLIQNGTLKNDVVRITDADTLAVEFPDTVLDLDSEINTEVIEVLSEVTSIATESELPDEGAEEAGSIDEPLAPGPETAAVQVQQDQQQVVIVQVDNTIANTETTGRFEFAESPKKRSVPPNASPNRFNSLLPFSNSKAVLSGDQEHAASQTIFGDATRLGLMMAAINHAGRRSGSLVAFSSVDDDGRAEAGQPQEERRRRRMSGSSRLPNWFGRPRRVILPLDMIEERSAIPSASPSCDELFANVSAMTVLFEETEQPQSKMSSSVLGGVLLGIAGAAANKGSKLRRNRSPARPTAATPRYTGDTVVFTD